MVSSFPLYETLIRGLELPRIGRRYRRQVVESEVGETIPFTEDEVDIAWTHRKSEKGMEVFAAAVRKDAIDGHVALLDRLATIRRRYTLVPSRWPRSRPSTTP